jgi:hypothetical protein
MMIDIDAIFNGKAKTKKGKQIDSFLKASSVKSGGLFDLDKILPSEKAVPSKPLPTSKPLYKEVKSSKPPQVIVHNHFHGMPQGMPQRQFPATQRKYLSAFTPKGMEDKDADGYPAYMDPNDNDPNVPLPMTKQFHQKKIDKILGDMLGGND